MITDHQMKIIDSYLLYDNFFSRMVCCHPDSEDYFKARIKSDDIKLLCSTYMDNNTFIMAKDCTLKVLSYTSGMDADDFINNTITIVPNFKIY